MDEERFNPFTEAIANARAGIEGVLRRTPPPRQVQEEIAEYDRRVSDPAAFPEWLAIYERHGVAGVMDYVESMKQTKKKWGL